MRPARRLPLPVCLLAVAAPAAAQGPPAGYYDTVDTTNAATLRATLHDVIDDHTRIPYTAASTDTWDVLEMADEDPNDSGNIIDVYQNASFDKQGGGNPFYQREHTWPNSYGFPNDGVTNYAYTDCHQLFLCSGSYNSARGNKPFKYCDASCEEWETAGGTSGFYPGLSNWTDGFLTFGTWEVWEGRKGDIARAQLYMDIRYEGGTHGITGASEPQLILTDDVNLIDAGNTGSNEPIAYMGMLSVLLQWHEDDPVDAQEMLRNDIVGNFQGNRNPFVDHPEWVSILHDSGSGGGIAWINEFHYDNAGADVGEFVEVVGEAGTNLAGWRVFGYNGNGGDTYDTLFLAGVIPDQGGSCLGAIAFDMSGLQNGAPDGLALVDSTDTVHHFVSYEGVVNATGGPANGMSSEDVGVVEDSSTQVGESIQLTGSGTGPGDFTWTGPLAQSRDTANAGQSFGDACGGDQDPPAAPTGLVATTAIGAVDLDWDDNAEGDLSFYRIYRSEVPGGPYGLLSTASGSSGTDASATPGTIYYYVVTAVDTSNNESDDSNEAQGEADPGPTGTPWINELHYDNDGSDTGEFFEIAGPAGFDLTGWSVVGYNGNGGASYASVGLSGTLPDQGGCRGTASFLMAGMQNGSPDGLALVDPTNSVVEFLSYEGAFVANGGPADGMLSEDIGVSEPSSTPIGHSLQRGGTGGAPGDFTWQAAQAETPGAVNTGQTFQGCEASVTLYGCGTNPADSLTHISGLPTLGGTVELGVDNPLGTQAVGSFPLVAVALAPAAGFPCGIPIPGWGMAGGGASGELLISIAPPNPLTPLLVGTPWAGAGTPAPVDVVIPNSAVLLGLSLYCQGLMFDPTELGPEIGLADAALLTVGS